MMEEWYCGIMGLKKPVFKTHVIPSFHAAYQENGRKKNCDTKNHRMNCPG
jgi:hypothetical protein